MVQPELGVGKIIISESEMPPLGQASRKGESNPRCRLLNLTLQVYYDMWGIHSYRKSELLGLVDPGYGLRTQAHGWQNLRLSWCQIPSWMDVL